MWLNQGIKMNIKTFAFGVAAAALVTTSASAADLPGRVIKGGIAPLATCFWAGPYVGAHAGYTWAQGESKGGSRPTVGPVVGGQDVPVKFEHSKITGGGYAGYNFCATPNFVVGVEGDFTKYGHNDEFSSIVGGRGYGKGFDANWGGSLRLRAGLPFDRFLVYGTVGLAGVNQKAYSYTKDIASGLNVDGFSKSKFALGYVVGVGGEYAFTQNIVGRVEYLYTDTGRFSLGNGNRVDSSFHTIRAGVAYKF
jgi:outer membrane immunogenic protein